MEVVTYYEKDGTVIRSLDELLQRDDGYIKVITDPEGITEESWYVHNKLSREDGPAVIISYHNLDNTVEERWYKNGILDRDQIAHPGPTISIYSDRGLINEQWIINGELHRINGPAFVNVQPNGSVIEKYYEHNKLHRKKGPAVIIYNVHDDPITQEWWTNGIKE